MVVEVGDRGVRVPGGARMRVQMLPKPSMYSSARTPWSGNSDPVGLPEVVAPRRVHRQHRDDRDGLINPRSGCGKPSRINMWFLIHVAGPSVRAAGRRLEVFNPERPRALLPDLPGPAVYDGPLIPPHSPCARNCDLLPGNRDRRGAGHGLRLPIERRVRSGQRLPEDVPLRAGGERVFVILTSGSLSISQSIMSLLRLDFDAGQGWRRRARSITPPGSSAIRSAGSRRSTGPRSRKTASAST